MWFTVSLILGAILLLVIYKMLSKSDNYWLDNNVPFVKFTDIVSLYDFFRGKQNFMDTDLKLYKLFRNCRYGGFIDFSPTPSIMLTDLELIKKVTVKDFDYFTDRREVKLSNTEKYLNLMLVNQKGHEWRDLRSALSPTFTSGKIRRMFEHFNRCGQGLNDYIEKHGTKEGDGHAVCISECIRRYVVDVIAATAFGMETSALKDPNSIFYKMAAQTTEMGFARKIKFLLFITLPKIFSMLGLTITDLESIKFFDTILKKALEQRQESSEKKDDFLQLLLEKRAGSGIPEDDSEPLDQFEKDAQVNSGKQASMILSDDVISAQSLLFFLAGFDTQGSTLGFAFFVLAIRQDVQEKLRAEIDSVMDDKEGISYDAIGKMTYLDMFLTETLRRYPPATRLERKCTRDYKFPDTNLEIKKGTIVILPAQGIHLDERYYRDPEKFDPERFSPENKAKIPQYAYLAFGVGPRNCIGMRFALMEAKVAIAHLVHQFHIGRAKSTPAEVMPEVGIGINRPDLKLEIKFTPRTDKKKS